MARRGSCLVLCLCLVFPLTVPAKGAPALPTCFGFEATIIGTTGDDRLRGTSGDDVIVSKTGSDVVHGRGGDDRICAGDGSDRVIGGLGSDRLQGGPGVDQVRGYGTQRESLDETVRNIVRGGAGNDAVYGASGDDGLFGGDGHDFISGWDGNDVAYGGDGTTGSFAKKVARQATTSVMADPETMNFEATRAMMCFTEDPATTVLACMKEKSTRSNLGTTPSLVEPGTTLSTEVMETMSFAAVQDETSASRENKWIPARAS